jgi:hypothetical protein
LLFQALDEKKKCAGIYVGGELCFGDISLDHLSRTWSYASFLEDRDIEYAKLYCGGLTLREACPEALKPRWEAIENKFKAFIKSFHTARISLNENCFFDLVPDKYLLEMCYIKDEICRHVFENYEKPSDYEYKLELTKVLSKIKSQPLKINSRNLLMFKHKHRQFAKKLNKIEPYCKFNIDGAKTGRLTTTPSGFPILTLNKEYRSVIEPHNDFFIELDFNAAELRTLLALQGKEQPKEDIHEWNVRNVFDNKLTREEAKKNIFAWLYNPQSQNTSCSNVYNREKVVQKYFTQGQVTTFFAKIIPSEERTALNYIIQSTCAENVLRQMIKLDKLLKGRKSFISFPIHDSVVIDFSLDDKRILTEIIDTFSQTELGDFLVNVSVGKNFGNLKKMEI